MKTERDIQHKITELENKLSLLRGGMSLENDADVKIKIHIKILAMENAVMHLRWVIGK